MAQCRKRRFCAYGIMSNRYGVTTQPSSIMVRGALKHEWNTTARWSWTAGADIIAQASSATDYARYQQSSKSWTERGLRPSAAHIQQLFAGIRYRSVFAIVGLKEYPSAILNDSPVERRLHTRHKRASDAGIIIRIMAICRHSIYTWSTTDFRRDIFMAGLLTADGLRTITTTIPHS